MVSQHFPKFLIVTSQGTCILPSFLWHDELQKKKISIFGTMQMDQKGIPPQIKTVDNRNKKSTFFVCGGDANLILVSYIDKEKNGKRNVVVLTPMHDKIKVTKEEKQKPQVHTFYVHTEVGVNIVNLNFRYILTRMKIKRWAMNYVTFILDTARKKANTILLNNNFKMISHEFTY